ncbi:MAG: phage tail assembly chaperone [Proteobacteria bacterium]|nr:phage tail assembly chaperone [Pseudomonadota bacterium]
MKVAMGRLGWTPAVFWTATPRELLAALDGWMELHAPRRPGGPLSDDEIVTFWHGLRDARMTETIRLALKLQLVTAQRRGEVIGAEWSELDRENGVWTIPAHKAKNRELHVVPLAPFALSLLDAIKENAGDSPFLFPSHIDIKPITPVAVSHALRKNCGKNGKEKIGVADVTPHDLRRSAATRMAALGVDRTVLARVLNHVDRSVTGRYDAYSYLDEKRAALERWGRKLEAIITGEAAKVVELAERRK